MQLDLRNFSPNLFAVDSLNKKTIVYPTAFPPTPFLWLQNEIFLPFMSGYCQSKMHYAFYSGKSQPRKVEKKSEAINDIGYESMFMYIIIIDIPFILNPCVIFLASFF